MLTIGPFLGALVGNRGQLVSQQRYDAKEDDKVKPKDQTAPPAVEEPSSNGVKFDLTVPEAAETQDAVARTLGSEGAEADPYVASGEGAGSEQAQGSDDGAMAAYFYAAKWAQSQKPAEAKPAESGVDDGFNFATEPYRRDLVAEYFSEKSVYFMGKKLATIGADGVVSSGDSKDGTVQPLQVPKSLGKF